MEHHLVYCGCGECTFCESGMLKYCVNCGGYEKGYVNTLTSDCPGVNVAHWIARNVAVGLMDYRNGQWVFLNRYGEAK